MKKTLLFISVLALFALGVMPVDGPLKRLTVINKSEIDIAIQLMGSESENFYYLRIPAGELITPTEKVFTVVRDQYSSTLYYIEPWDPIYGVSCNSTSRNLDLNRNVRVIVQECDRPFPNAGEPPAIIKYGAVGGGKGADGKEDR